MSRLPEIGDDAADWKLRCEEFFLGGPRLRRCALHVLHLALHSPMEVLQRSCAVAVWITVAGLYASVAVFGWEPGLMWGAWPFLLLHRLQLPLPVVHDSLWVATTLLHVYCGSVVVAYLCVHGGTLLGGSDSANHVANSG